MAVDLALNADVHAVLFDAASRHRLQGVRVARPRVLDLRDDAEGTAPELPELTEAPR
jgi:hypothetical protein